MTKLRGEGAHPVAVKHDGHACSGGQLLSGYSTVTGNDDVDPGSNPGTAISRLELFP